MVKTQKSKTTKRKTPVRKPKSVTAKTSARKPKTAPKFVRPKFTWRENLFLGLISACAICMIVALVAESSFDPQRDAELTIERLAREYYLNHYYPTIIRENPDHPTATLELYSHSGLPLIRLRQLLAQTPDAASRVQNQFYHCDTNKTFVRYFPVEPYGAHDYTFQITYDCQKSISD